MLNSKKLSLAHATIAALTAQLTGAGFKVEDLTAQDASPDALKDAIQSKINAGSTSAESVIKSVFGEKIEAHDESTAKGYLEELAADAAQAESLQGQVNTFESALKSNGIRLEAPAEGEAHSEESIAKAITNRVGTLAQERLAAHGISEDAAPEVKVSAESTAPNKEPENKRLSHAMSSLKKLGMGDV